MSNATNVKADQDASSSSKKQAESNSQWGKPQDAQVQISVPKDKSEVIRSFQPADFSDINGREEEWRFTPMKRVGVLADRAAAPSTVDAKLALPDLVSSQKISVDELSASSRLVPNDLVSALAWDSSNDATVVSVEPKAQLDEPIEITISNADHGVSLTRLVIGHDAAATAIVTFVGKGHHASNVEVVIEDRAIVDVIVVQDWEDSAVHVSRLHTRVGRDAQYRQFVASLTGDLVRVTSTVDYEGAGGSADLYGAYFADAGQHLEHRLFADHNQPHCRSNVVYKGALVGEDAHTVWIGDVLIRAHAVGTDTYEINRNLVLSDGARADSVPNLEIETGEVTGAGHASTTGRFDDEQLFYLQARGIDADRARKLVVRGFFSDVLDEIKDENVRSVLWSSIDSEIAQLSSGDEKVSQ